MYLSVTAALVVYALTFNASPVEAATLWTGPRTTVTKAAFADPTLETNQDRITDNVWLTRGDQQGFYNAKVELGYQSLSPADTEWALGTLADVSTASFTNFQALVLGSGRFPALVGQDIILHLISEDIFIDFKITEWGMRAPGGGAFTYERSTAPIPEPSTLVAAAFLVAALVARRGAAHRVR